MRVILAKMAAINGEILNEELDFFTDINDCSSGPCNNGGICNDGVNSYTCTCAAGYNGDYCDNSEYTISFLNFDIIYTVLLIITIWRIL